MAARIKLVEVVRPPWKGGEEGRMSNTSSQTGDNNENVTRKERSQSLDGGTLNLVIDN